MDPDGFLCDCCFTILLCLFLLQLHRCNTISFKTDVIDRKYPKSHSVRVVVVHIIRCQNIDPMTQIERWNKKYVQPEISLENVPSVKFNLTSSFLLAGAFSLAHPPSFVRNSCYIPLAMSGVILWNLDSGSWLGIVRVCINESPHCCCGFVIHAALTYWYSFSLLVLMGGIITEATGCIL